jgi:predicted ATP-dependent serine protease
MLKAMGLGGVPLPASTLKEAAKEVIREEREAVDRKIAEVADIEGSRIVLLKDALNDPTVMTPPRELFPGIAYAGRATLFAGREKIGKSHMLSLIASEADTNAPILYYTFEEALGDTARRLRQYGADPDKIYLVTGCKSLAELKQDITDFGAELVMVDSLFTLIHHSLGVQASENSDEAGRYVQPITSIAHDTGCAIVLLHHANRSSGTYRGSSTIGAGVDLITEIYTKGDADERKFRVNGRIKAESDVPVKWDDVTEQYCMRDDVLSDVIMDVIAAAQQWREDNGKGSDEKPSKSWLRKNIKRSPNNVVRAVERLEEQGSPW